MPQKKSLKISKISSEFRNTKVIRKLPFSDVTFHPTINLTANFQKQANIPLKSSFYASFSLFLHILLGDNNLSTWDHKHSFIFIVDLEFTRHWRTFINLSIQKRKKIPFITFIKSLYIFFLMHVFGSPTHDDNKCLLRKKGTTRQNEEAINVSHAHSK